MEQLRISSCYSSAASEAWHDAGSYDLFAEDDQPIRVTGRKRHILVDTLGLLLNVAVHSADVQDRDGAPRVLDARTRRFFPFIEHIFADGGYQGSQLARRLARTGSWLIEIVKRPDISRFEVLPKRWIVERTL